MDECHHVCSTLFSSQQALLYSLLAAVYLLSVVTVEKPCCLPMVNVLIVNCFSSQRLRCISLAAGDFVLSGLFTACALYASDGDF